MGFIDSITARVRRSRLQSAWDKARARKWPDAVAAYLKAGPPKVESVLETPVLAIDLETDGLDPIDDHIVSAGWVPVEDAAVRGSLSRHIIVAAPGERSRDAVAVHGLTDTDVARGVQLKEMLDPFYEALAGRVMLAHFSDIELGFLRQASIQAYGAAPPLVALDTMVFELERRRARGAVEGGSLRLLHLRNDYGLPHYESHHALGDAHACAELYLAQLRRDRLADAPVFSMLRAML